jgi:hypothetical protein
VTVQSTHREKSLVVVRSKICADSGGISKAVSEFDISEFESSYPSQPVQSLRAISIHWKKWPILPPPEVDPFISAAAIAARDGGSAV